MALTIASAGPTATDVWGRARIAILTVTFDNAYAANGEDFTPAMAGMSEFLVVVPSPDAHVLPGYFVEYDYIDEKLVVRMEEAVAAGGPLVDATGNLSTLVVKVLCVGI